MNKQLYLPLAVAMALATGTATAAYHSVDDVSGGDDGAYNGGMDDGGLGGGFDDGGYTGGDDGGYTGGDDGGYTGGDDNGGMDDGYAGDDNGRDYDWGDKDGDGKIPDMAGGKDSYGRDGYGKDGYVPPEICDVDKDRDGKDDGRGKPDEGGVGVIPIPAAAWLFGSGLVGLVGMAKRRSKKV